MTGAPETKQKRRAVLVLRFSLLFVFFAILFYWLQPFAKRYEGKTARDWLASSTHAGIRRDVVDAFGAEVVPDLIGTLSFCRFASNVALWILPDPEAFDLLERVGLWRRQQVATDWLTILHHHGHRVFPHLIEAGQTNVVFNALCYHPAEDLEKMLREEADPLIRVQMERAKALTRAAEPPDVSRLMVSTNKSAGWVSPRKGLKAPAAAAGSSASAAQQ